MRRTKNEFMDEEWEFDSYDEMVTAADTEGRVCGDDIRKSDDRKTIEIFNHHRCSVRWKGFLKILLITLAVSLGGCSDLRIQLPDGSELRHTRFLDKEKIGSVSYDDGSFTMDGYESDTSRLISVIQRLVAEKKESDKKLAALGGKP